MNIESWTVISAIGQVGGVIALMIVYNRESNQTQVIERREIYQRLELSSIDLFRFEHEHVDVFRAVWFDDIPMELDSLEYLRTKQYMCQILNLFEMATSFLDERIITAEVFGSWLVWMYELAERPTFRTAWAHDLRPNYIRKLRQLLDTAVRRSEQPDGLAGFYAEAGVIMGRPEIARFGDELSKEEVSS